MTSHATTPVSPAHKAPVAMEEVAAEPAVEEPQQPEKQLIKSQKYIRQVAMSKNFFVTAWRKASLESGHLANGIKFRAIPKKEDPEYQEIYARAKAIEADWKAKGEIPEEYRSKITASEYEFDDEAAARKQKRKAAKATRAITKQHKEMVKKMKEDAEAKGEEFVEPPKPKRQRKRKTASDESDAKTDDEQPKKKKRANKKKVADLPETIPGDAEKELIKAPAPIAEADAQAEEPVAAEKPKKKRAPKKKVAEVAAPVEDVVPDVAAVPEAEQVTPPKKARAPRKPKDPSAPVKPKAPRKSKAKAAVEEEPLKMEVITKAGKEAFLDAPQAGVCASPKACPKSPKCPKA